MRHRRQGRPSQAARWASPWSLPPARVATVRSRRHRNAPSPKIASSQARPLPSDSHRTYPTRLIVAATSTFTASSAPTLILLRIRNMLPSEKLYVAAIARPRSRFLPCCHQTYRRQPL
ncbi:hypothetical protein V8G54_010265 [Vigna mungo]|uniref:Uncharacterized protein n=1 Tax=Vigna mungo TaxID=3915 RepID=A0AAQ3S5L6_VIGMU